MKFSHRCLGTLAAACIALSVHAESSPVAVSDAWVRATTPQQKATGAFMKLESKAPATLVGASSPAASLVEVHEMRTENGVMQMRAVPRLPLPAGQTVALKPGGYHIMLIDLKAPLSPGQKVPLTLVIETEGKARQNVTVDAEVRPLNGAVPAHAAH
jgi:copper(I)-binding protein